MKKFIISFLFSVLMVFGFSQNVFAFNSNDTITDNGTSYTFHVNSSPVAVALWNGDTATGIFYTSPTQDVIVQKSSLSDGTYHALWSATDYSSLTGAGVTTYIYQQYYDWKYTFFDTYYGGATFVIASAISGCMDSEATNYNALATVSNGSCTYPVSGCMDSEASNYNALATVSNGSCTYSVISNGGYTSGYTSQTQPENLNKEGAKDLVINKLTAFGSALLIILGVMIGFMVAYLVFRIGWKKVKGAIK